VTPRERWLDALGFALASGAHKQANPLSACHWAVPRSEPGMGDCHITVRDGRVSSWSCVEVYGGRSRPEHPCYHAGAVVLALLVAWWDDEGLTCDLSAVDDVRALWGSVVGFLPAGVAEEQEVAA
jgi:hypothetical protein